MIDELMSYLGSLGFEVYAETIPPGPVRERALGRALRIGDLIVDVKPEIVSLPPQMLSGIPVAQSFEYVENDLAIAYVGSEGRDWCKLRGRRVAIPNPVTEGIGGLFRDLYNEYCSDYLDFVSRNPVILTKIHRRTAITEPGHRGGRHYVDHGS